MGSYLIRRLLLVIPTLWAIITINFFIVQIAPGGPVDQAIAAIEFNQRGGMPGAGDGGMGASHAAQAISARVTIAAGAASTRKSSPRSPTATASINRCTNAI